MSRGKWRQGSYGWARQPMLGDGGGVVTMEAPQAGALGSRLTDVSLRIHQPPVCSWISRKGKKRRVKNWEFG